MVRLENRNGVGVYLHADEVKSISPHGPSGPQPYSMVKTKDSFFVIKGATDEVFKRLHAEKTGAIGFSNVVRNEAMLEVLEWAAEDNSEPCPSGIVELARKALGRV